MARHNILVMWLCPESELYNIDHPEPQLNLEYLMILQAHAGNSFWIRLGFAHSAYFMLLISSCVNVSPTCFHDISTYSKYVIFDW